MRQSLVKLEKLISKRPPCSPAHKYLHLKAKNSGLHSACTCEYLHLHFRLNRVVQVFTSTSSPSPSPSPSSMIEQRCESICLLALRASVEGFYNSIWAVSRNTTPAIIISSILFIIFFLIIVIILLKHIMADSDGVKTESDAPSAQAPASPSSPSLSSSSSLIFNIIFIIIFFLVNIIINTNNFDDFLWQAQIRQVTCRCNLHCHWIL